MRKSYEQDCPVAVALDIVGERWTLLIVKELLSGPARFTQILQQLHGIPSNLLIDRLSSLEEQGLVERVYYSERPPRALYQLTPPGRALRGVVEALRSWCVKHVWGRGLSAPRRRSKARGRHASTGARRNGRRPTTRRQTASA